MLLKSTRPNRKAQSIAVFNGYDVEASVGCGSKAEIVRELNAVGPGGDGGIQSTN